MLRRGGASWRGELEGLSQLLESQKEDAKKKVSVSQAEVEWLRVDFVKGNDDLAELKSLRDG